MRNKGEKVNSINAHSTEEMRQSKDKYKHTYKQTRGETPSQADPSLPLESWMRITTEPAGHRFSHVTRLSEASPYTSSLLDGGVGRGGDATQGNLERLTSVAERGRKGEGRGNKRGSSDGLRGLTSEW